MSESAAERRGNPRRLEVAGPASWRSRLATVLATLLAVSGLAVCAACGFGLYVFRPMQYDDADRARRITAEMLRVDVPAAFEPRGTIEWDFFRTILMRGSYYELTGDDGLLMFLQVDSALLAEPDIRLHVERTLRDKGGGGPPLTITASEDVDYFLGDQHVVFRRRTGESPTAQTKKFQLIEGTVNGHSGTVLVAFRVSQEAWERADQNAANLVEATIRSIRPSPAPAASRARPAP